MEKNILFFADQRYQVTMQGPAIVSAPLFDGSMQIAQTSSAISPSSPLVILIENLPSSAGYHTQAGAWVGWSSRYLFPSHFKIEAYNTYLDANTWVDVSEATNYGDRHYMVAMPQGVFSKLRFTFYEGFPGTGSVHGFLQLSELFYLLPEGAQVYDGLMVKYNAAGNVGIGTATPAERLSVNGNIRAKEIKVEMANWPDYVFNADYPLTPLPELEAYIKENGHLPGIPTASNVEADGVALAEMNRKLLEKVEELTLHLITIRKELDMMKAEKSNQ
ncbi:hypothetical protein [Parapedobacter sp. DT-150]|uniref:hypothetical protein n=1 Tax=Parapedobacter sp. DT-150 TaxID=3396162 RepID=UPI003F1A7CDE